MLHGLLLCIAFAQGVELPADLPPVDDWPRTRAEWDAKTEQRAAKRGYGRFTEMYPEFADTYDFMQAQQVEIVGEFTKLTKLDAAHAELMVSELYSNFGHPILNSAHQGFLLRELFKPVSQWPRNQISPEARQILVQGLLHYADAGGGQRAPGEQAEFAVVISNLAENGDQRAKAAADRLLSDARSWADDLGFAVFQRAVERAGVEIHGPAFRLRLADADIESLPQRYVRACRHMRRLLEDLARGNREPVARRVREAVEQARIELEQPQLEQDLRRRFFILVEEIARLDPPAADLTLRTAERGLCEMARPNEITTDALWNQWTDAAYALYRKNRSNALRSLIDRLSKEDRVPAAARKRLSTLHDLLTNRADRDEATGNTGNTASEAEPAASEGNNR